MLRITLNERGAFAGIFMRKPAGWSNPGARQWDQLGLCTVGEGRRAISVNEVCLRLAKDVQSPSLTKDINTWLANTEIDNSKVHLILDLQTVGADELSYLKPYKNIPFINEWRTIPIVGGSFPKGLQDLSVGEHLLPRLSGILEAVAENSSAARADVWRLHNFTRVFRPSFPGMNVSASIGDTTDDHW